MAASVVVRSTADRVGLKDWGFTVQAIEPKADGYGSTCEIVVGRKHAVLSFPVDWDWERLTEAQMQTVIHELLHCHFDQYKIVLNRLSGIVTDHELAITELAMRDVIEYGIDSVATALL